MILELKRFKKAADLGAVTKASEVLFITQPAMTQSIQRLEKELGFKLFKHEGKKVYLTEKGKMVSEISEKIIALWEKAKSLRNPENSPQEFSIGVFDSSALLLTEYFNKISSQLKVEIIIDRSEILLKKLRLGLIDLCICVMPQDKHLYSGFDVVEIYKEKLIPVSAGISIKNIEDTPFIMYSRDSQTGIYVARTFINAGIEPKVVSETSNPLFIKEMALKNLGTAILPYNMVKDDIEENKLFVQKFPVKFERAIAIFKNKESDNPVLTSLIHEMREELKKHLIIGNKNH